LGALGESPGHEGLHLGFEGRRWCACQGCACLKALTRRWGGGLKRISAAALVRGRAAL
jgi:hypothetical protein